MSRDYVENQNDALKKAYGVLNMELHIDFENHVKASFHLLSRAQGLIGEGRLASVSSFGAESAVLLHLISQVNKDFPIFFLETGKHFKETLSYVDQLSSRLRLTNVQFISPNIHDIQTLDADDELWSRDPDQCCAIRKINPLAETLKKYDGWITGRKHIHGGGRDKLAKVEWSDGKIKLNPLVDWSEDQLQNHFSNFGLPQHPLVNKGYSSIGCENCTSKPAAGLGGRSGRWAGQGKVECGIHRSA